MQFHSPSVVQAVPAVIAEPVPVVPVLAGVGEAAGAEVALDAPADDAIVAKTPPVAAGDEDATTAAGVVVLDAAALEAPPVAIEAPPVATTAAPQDGPVGVAVAEVDNPNCSSESPGSGKTTSFESWVLHEDVGILATNMFGRALNAAVSRSISMV